MTRAERQARDRIARHERVPRGDVQVWSLNNAFTWHLWASVRGEFAVYGQGGTRDSASRDAIERLRGWRSRWELRCERRCEREERVRAFARRWAP